ncbi:MAG: cofactor-independent phosphoglycerate mutase [Candidatus Omnitrophica bacterium]|nr:cofactor-independent phosphoglycerate mutase [Candidatus Omnitrophota bacterium]
MKYIILVPDGMADRPLKELDGKTPLEVSKIPNMTYFAQHGRVGMAQTIPQGCKPGSDVANLSLLGYDPREFYTGRAPLEAANMGIELKEGEVAFRCNLITEFDGKMADYSAGHISNEEAAVLIELLNEKIGSDNVRFYPGVSYRHICVIKTKRGLEELSAKCVPPHDILGKPVQSYFPSGEGADVIREIMLKAKTIMQNHEVNIIRLDLKENPANMIWLWGQGITPDLQSFAEKNGVQGSIISAVDLIKGIGKVIGLDVIDVPGATGYFDTDYDAKGRYAVESLDKKDFVFVHVEAPDEAGHEGKIKAKIQAIENFDYHIAGQVRKYCEKNPDTRVLVVPDHATPISVRTHTMDPVPFILYGKNVIADEILTYSESVAELSSFKVEEGHKLVDVLIGKE